MPDPVPRRKRHLRRLWVKVVLREAEVEGLLATAAGFDRFAVEETSGAAVWWAGSAPHNGSLYKGLVRCPRARRHDSPGPGRDSTGKVLRAKARSIPEVAGAAVRFPRLAMKKCIISMCCGDVTITAPCYLCNTTPKTAGLVPF